MPRGESARNRRDFFDVRTFTLVFNRERLNLQYKDIIDQLLLTKMWRTQGGVPAERHRLGGVGSTCGCANFVLCRERSENELDFGGEDHECPCF